jgi:hypothetical protein
MLLVILETSNPTMFHKCVSLPSDAPMEADLCPLACKYTNMALSKSKLTDALKLTILNVT